MAAKLTIDGDRLLALRRRNGFTQQAAAEKSRLTTARLRVLEHGGGNVRLDTLARLADIYGIHPCELLAWSP